MIHVAPVGLYQFLQKDMDTVAGDGYQVFFEGVSGFPKLRSRATRQEREIAKFFKLIFDLYPVMAAAWGFGLQRKNIKYPENAINADLPFKEVVKLLKEKGFRCGFILRIIALVEKERKHRGEADFTETMKEALAKTDPLKKQRKGFWYFIMWLFLFRKLFPVIVGCRNRVTTDIIENHSADKNFQNIFVHYGEGHIAGMTKLLKRKGWRLVNISKLDLSTFRAKEGTI